MSFEFHVPKITEEELELLKEFDLELIVPKDIHELEKIKSKALADMTYEEIGQANAAKLISILEN